MSTNEDHTILPGMKIRMNRAIAITEAQYLEADRIVTHTFGIGGAHPDKAALVAALMQVLATNLNAVVANSAK